MKFRVFEIIRSTSCDTFVIAAKLSISRSVSRGDCSTPRCTILFGSRINSIRSSRPPLTANWMRSTIFIFAIRCSNDTRFFTSGSASTAASAITFSSRNAFVSISASSSFCSAVAASE